ncbi:N-acetyl-alpha-D-glucosaminyl L-malate deacetylase 1 [anaerobic digester metagenome]
MDDLELACGGTLARAVRNGHEVRMVVLSKSDYTHYSGKYGRSAEVAVDEGKNAAKALGVEQFVVYDFPTKDIPNDSTVVEVLNKEFDEFQPDLIMTHWQFDTHKSHANTALTTMAAARYFNSIIMFEPFPPAGRSYAAFRPQLYIDITETIDVKLKALATHKSELAKYGPEWIETIKARAQLRGFELISADPKRLKYAEAFEVVRLNYNF